MMENKNDITELDKLAIWMDSKFTIPGTSFRFGLDSILGLIPGVGDTLTLASLAYLLGKASSYNVPKRIMAVMCWNAFLDWLIGLIPLLGDIFDVGWKSNLKNVALIKKYARPTVDEVA